MSPTDRRCHWPRGSRRGNDRLPASNIDLGDRRGCRPPDDGREVSLASGLASHADEEPEAAGDVPVPTKFLRPA